MKRLTFITTTLLSATILFVSCSKDDDYKPQPEPPSTPEATVVSAAGDLTVALTQFRGLLGDQLNTTPGQTTGRREINWDGVPANLTNVNSFPFDFFNVTDPALPAGRKRGLIYNNGSSFRVDSTSYAEVDASYASEFKPFSGKRLFNYMGNNVTQVFFKIAGSNTDGFVRGFGLVFSDVDNANATTVEYFNGDKSLGTYKAPVRNDANGFSFLGVHFPREKVTRVKITAGNGLLGAGAKDISQGGAKDLVVMDDFFYDEPKTLN